MKIKWFSLKRSSIILLVLLCSKLYCENEKFFFGTKLTLPFVKANFALHENDFNFGINAFSNSFCKIVPISVMAGNLNAGGSASKMNNPVISNSNSPFSTGISNVGCVSASLPGISSFSKPVSSFFQIGFANKNLFLKDAKINCFYSPEDETLLFSSYNSLAFFKKKFEVQNSITCGFFPYEENTSNSWFVDSQYYPKGNHFCSYYQLGLKYLKSFLGFNLGVYETPFGNLVSNYKADLKLPGNHFIFYFSAFYNPSNVVITSSDKNINEFLQFKLGFENKYLIGKKSPVFFKFATNLYSQINMEKTEHPCKFNYGIQITSNLCTFSFANSISFSVNSENIQSPSLQFESTNLQFKNKWNFSFLIPTVSFAININPNDDFSSINLKYTLGGVLYFPKNPKISGSGNYTINTTDNTLSSQKLSGSLNITTTIKDISFIFKFSADISF